MIAKKPTRKPTRKSTVVRESIRPRHVLLSSAAVEYVERYRKLLGALFRQIAPGSTIQFEISDAEVIESVLSSAWAASLQLGPVQKKARIKGSKPAKR